MSKYYYSKYNAIASYIVGDFETLSDFTTNNQYYVLYSSYSLNASTGIFANAGAQYYAGVQSSAGKIESGKYYYVSSNNTITRYLLKYTSTGYGGVFASAYFSAMKATSELSYSKGTLVQENLVAEDGTYPNDGRHTDGYWYVRGSITNILPIAAIDCVQISKDEFKVIANITDSDSNFVQYKMNLNGFQYPAATGWSELVAVPYTATYIVKRDSLLQGLNTIKIDVYDTEDQSSYTSYIDIPFSNVNISQVTPLVLYDGQHAHCVISAQALQDDGIGGKIEHNFSVEVNEAMVSDMSFETSRTIDNSHFNIGNNTLTIRSDDNQTASIIIKKEELYRIASERFFCSISGGFIQNNIYANDSDIKVKNKYRSKYDIVEEKFVVSLDKFIRNIRIS